MRSRLYIVLSLGGWFLCGCNQSPPAVAPAASSPAGAERTDGPPAPTPEPQPEPKKPASETVELKSLDWEGVEQLIASRQGRIVVVDLWATYCGPCRKEFPGLIALSHAHPEDVACISVSLDDADDQEAVVAFLQEQQATIDNVLCTTDPDTLYDEILKIGAIPAVYVYGRDGTMLKLFNGPAENGQEHTYNSDITPFVEHLIDQG